MIYDGADPDSIDAGSGGGLNPGGLAFPLCADDPSVILRMRAPVYLTMTGVIATIDDSCAAFKHTNAILDSDELR